MKKIYIAFLISVLSAALTSCERSFLEPWPPDAARQADDIWGYYYYTKGVIDRVYSDCGMCAYINDIEGSFGHFACATDEAEHSVSTAAVQRFTNGNWTPTNTPTTYFGNPYNGHSARDPWYNDFIGMRRLHNFLKNVDHSAMIDDPDDPTRAHERTYGKGQAYFWRAWLGFDLLRRYGHYPISLGVEDIDEELYRTQNTLDECVAQILKDCDSAALMLPVLWDEANWGRVNTMHAMALKSRLLLYYASPLYQGDFETFGLKKGEVGDEQRWKDAADAARDAINANEFYNLMPVSKYVRPFSGVGTYGYQIGLTGNLENTEVIFSCGFSTGYSNQNEYYNLPAGVDGCYGYTNPTQDFVDMFEVVTGKGTNAKAEPFDWNNPEHAKDPYMNPAANMRRDTRFYNTVIYNGMIWGETSNKAYTVYTYEPVTIDGVSYPGGIHRDKTLLNSTKTGYYYRKYLNESFYAYVSGKYSTTTRSRHEIRFAELVLNYAEAMNEAYGPDGVDPKGELREINGTAGINTARAAVNVIRARVQMPPIPSDVNTKEAMREAIHHERTIELCYEGQRYYDLRRWKEAEEVLGKPIHGIKITPTEFKKGVPTAYKYEVEKVEDRVWKDCYYWFPVPYSEMVKYVGHEETLDQNPGWK